MRVSSLAHSPASLQLEITVKMPKIPGKRFEITREFMDEVVRGWADEGEAPPGITVRIVSWTHLDTGRTTKAGNFSQDEIREKFRGLLWAGRFTVQLRPNPKTGKTKRNIS